MEFALLAPVLILMFTGAVSLGLASWTKMQVGNAARAGAVYAVNHGYNQANIQAAAQNATALSTKVIVSSNTAPLRWSRPVGQFSGRVKLGSGCRQAASLSVTLAPYASSGVRPANVE